MALTKYSARIAPDPSSSSATQSFSTQYLSLILIILTFIIGVFASHHVQEAKYRARMNVSGQVPEGHAHYEERAFGKLHFDGIFADGGAVMHVDAVAPLSQVLRSHDIRVQAVAALPQDGSFEVALARSATLFRYFLEQGVPVEALEVVAIEEIQPWQVEVQFSAGNSHER